MIGIIDYGSGNIQAICNIYRRLGLPFVVARQPDDIANASRLLLPGVGAFDQAVTALTSSGMRQALDHAVLVQGKPVLGICVGMQLLADSSEEGTLQGLGWIPGRVRRFEHARFSGKAQLPHMGWNSVSARCGTGLFGVGELDCEFYFLHSYYFSCEVPAHVIGVTDYGGAFAAAVAKGSVYGVQFHPEKSHSAGIKLLRNFALSRVEEA